jgi:hypothetical protein
MTPHQILSFDCESDGLWGDTFAVGAALVSVPNPTKVFSTFTGRCSVTLTDPWAREHLPNLNHMFCYDSAEELREEFWVWLLSKQHPRASTMVLADVSFPVEARFLTQCVADQRRKHPGTQWLNAPYPLHELASLLYAIGEDPIELNRREWPLDILIGKPPNLVQHNPYDDALSAAWCAIKALQILEEQRERLQG